MQSGSRAPHLTCMLLCTLGGGGGGVQYNASFFNTFFHNLVNAVINS